MQAAQASVVTLSTFSSRQNSLPVNSIVSNKDSVCLTAVLARKTIFVSRVAPNTSEDNIKNDHAAKAPSVISSQHRAISPFRVLVLDENMGILLNKALCLIRFLIKEVIP